MHYVRYAKIGFSLGLKFRDVISINARYGGSGQISRNTILLKVHGFFTGDNFRSFQQPTFSLVRPMERGSK